MSKLPKRVDDLLKFVDDKHTIEQAVEGSMEKRLATTLQPFEVQNHKRLKALWYWRVKDLNTIKREIKEQEATDD